MSKFWSFIKNEASGDNPASVELRIDGYIVDDDSAWIYEWFGITATAPNAFREELNQYKGQNLDIVVWIDSYGGDVFAAAGIYNALKEYNAKDGKVTVKVDGKAMSAASVIAMAGTEGEVFMSPVGIMMIHNPLAGVKGYASDMRKAADVLDVVKDTIINAYILKTKKSRNEISAMMDDETYMSANVAVKEGFADGVLYSDSANDGGGIMNIAYNRMTIQNCAAETAKHLSAMETILKNKQATGKEHLGSKKESFIANKSEGGEGEVKITNVEELRNEYPDLVTQVEAAAKNEGITEGTTAERERIKAIDEISQAIDPELVIKAKYKEPQTAEQLAFASVKNDAAKGAKYLNNLEIDATVSGTNGVNGQGLNTETKKEKDAKEQAEAANTIAAFANKRR